MVGHLISWPVVILIIVFLFLRQIRELLPSLRHARFGENVELDFREKIEELEERADQIQLPPPSDEEQSTPSPRTEAERRLEETQRLIEEHQQRLEEAQRQQEEAQRLVEERLEKIEEARQRGEEAWRQASEQAEEDQQRLEDVQEEVRRQEEETQRLIEERLEQIEEAQRQQEEAEEVVAQRRREYQERRRLGMLYLLANTNPSSAVLEAWRDVEVEAMKLAERTDIFPTSRRRTALNVFKALHNSGVIDSDVAAIADQLRQLRNKAAHHPEPDISTEDAWEYIDVAERVGEYLRRLSRSEGTQG
jgi:DNA repair exonuclease SbcCD ATPase subunit